MRLRKYLRLLKRHDYQKYFVHIPMPKIGGWPFMVRRISGHSMMPILPPNTLVLGWCWTNKFSEGSVVIFRHDGKEKIKRIDRIGLKGRLFVVGEHKEASTDSRHFGPIDPKYVMARVILPNTRPRS